MPETENPLSHAWRMFLHSWKSRPWWMNLIWYFTIYMTFVYVPWDVFFKPVDQDAEAWFGFLVFGWWAKATGLLHWAIYAALAYGFWKMHRWMHPWAALYFLQVALGMAIYNLLGYTGFRPVIAVIVFVIFMVPVVALYRSRRLFADEESTET